MVELTVSAENFSALVGAHPYEKVCIKHKNMRGEVWLEKKHHKVPEVRKTSRVDYEDIDCACIETLRMEEYTKFITECIKQGYVVSSTDCSDGKWRAVMVKGGISNGNEDSLHV